MSDPSSLQVRPGITADADVVDAWLHTRQPLPVPAARARRVMLEALLGQGGQGLCVVAATVDGMRGCLPVSLAPNLSLHGQACCVTEWWGDPADAEALEACLAMLGDWCRAHGVRHVLLAPGLSATPPRGFALHPSGMWHLVATPAAKVLG